MTKKKNSLKRKLVEESIDVDALRFLKYRVSEKYSTERNLFLKRDASKENGLIVTNVPAFLGEDVVLAFINKISPNTEIEDSFVQRSNAADNSLTNGQITVSITFVKPESVNEILCKCQNVGPYTASDFAELDFPTVLKETTSLYCRLFPSEEQIQEMAETYIERYDQDLADARREAKKKYSEPDEDGWITVTRNKKAAKAVKLKKDEIPLIGGLGNPKKRKVDLAFYTFQAKKDKQQKAQELLKKFEDDKKRIAQLKQSRNFKPM
ncbi:unnamed protein product [Caenorhabditis angaria]|nr:unnamed protein product [Caenorhabditis angaria]